MQIEPTTLRAAFVALQEAHAYIAHPHSLKPCASKRVATHRVPAHHYAAMESNLRTALQALHAILEAEPVPT